MSKHNSLSSNWLSSPNWFVQVLGALISPGAKLWGLVLFSIILLVALFFLSPKLCLLAGITAVVAIVYYVVHTLTPIYCLCKQEVRITWSQIVFLSAVGLWMIVVIMLIDSSKFPNLPIIVSVISAVLSWIFQDTIKSVVAFFYLRANDLLKIDDWIEVKSHGIDGMVKGISLTTVTIENWDTTTSAFPTYILNSQHFRNYQKMVDGKTYGRQMQKTFIVDTSWIHTVTEDELLKIKEVMAGLKDEKKDFFENYITMCDSHDNVLNIELYRKYIYHWLMHNPHVSHEPRLIVRWLEQRPEGMPLQVYAFITDTGLAAFEWQQSQIMEHIIESMAWFNLQLYQSASGYDAGNNKVLFVTERANYRREFDNHGSIL